MNSSASVTSGRLHMRALGVKRLHRLDVMQVGVAVRHRGDVGDDQPGQQVRAAERQNHRRLAAHRVAEDHRVAIAEPFDGALIGVNFRFGL